MSFVLFCLPSAQSCSLAIDACHHAASNNSILKQLRIVQQSAWRALYSTEAKDYPFIIMGYGEKSEIKFQSTEKQKEQKSALFT